MITGGSFCRAGTPLQAIAALAASLALFPSPVIAANPAVDSSGPVINSYIDYVPTSAEYPSALAPAVEKLAAAVRADLKAPPSNQKTAPGAKPDGQAKARFNPSIEQLNAMRPKIARGYLDELDFLLGYAIERSGDAKQALSIYERSLNLRSDNLVAAFRRGMALSILGQYDTALNQFREIEWRSPALHHEVYFKIADCLTHQNKKDEAVKYVERAHQAEPSYIPVVRQLVQIRTDLLDTTHDPAQKSQLEHQILGDLGQILEKNPDDRDIGLLYAGLLLKFSDPLIDSDRIDRAASIARKFSEKSDFGDDKAVMMLVNSLLKKRDVDGAQKALDQGLKKHPHSTELQSGRRQLEIERGG